MTTGAVDDVDRPAAISAEDAARGWSGRADRPEMRCVPAWSEACRAWWEAADDPRLRRRVCEVLLVSEAELERFKARGLDEPSLIDAHRHVVAMRAALERGSVRRTLVTGALRDAPVFSHYRTGRLVVFMPAAEVPQHIARVAAGAPALPAHPLMRSAWICEVLGAIHPFVDSNGGTARFMASIELARAWLPPLALSWAQRNGSYLAAVVAHDLGALELVLHETVQHELARMLLGDDAVALADDATARRAIRWRERVDEAWRRAAGSPVRVDAPGVDGFVRLARRGYRVPRETTQCTRWRIDDPVPVQIELAVCAVRGGPTSWNLAMLAGSVGDDGVLGPLVGREEVVPVFVAASTEADADVDARFASWLDARIGQCLRGLAAWM